MRHAVAGYDIAKDCARDQGMKLPMAVQRRSGAAQPATEEIGTP